jgi:hypothetical protein
MAVSFRRRHGHPEDGESVAPDTKSNAIIIARGHVDEFYRAGLNELLAD